MTLFLRNRNTSHHSTRFASSRRENGEEIEKMRTLIAPVYPIIRNIDTYLLVMCTSVGCLSSFLSCVSCRNLGICFFTRFYTFSGLFFGGFSNLRLWPISSHFKNCDITTGVCFLRVCYISLHCKGKNARNAMCKKCTKVVSCALHFLQVK